MVEAAGTREEAYYFGEFLRLSDRPPSGMGWRSRCSRNGLRADQNISHLWVKIDGKTSLPACLRERGLSLREGVILRWDISHTICTGAWALPRVAIAGAGNMLGNRILLRLLSGRELGINSAGKRIKGYISIIGLTRLTVRQV